MNLFWSTFKRPNPQIVAGRWLQTPATECKTSTTSCWCHLLREVSQPRLNSWDGFQRATGTVTSRFLCFPETALSRRRNQSVLLPKGTPYSASIVKQMIEADAAVGFDVPIPDGAKFVEASMPPTVIRPYRQARQAPHLAGIFIGSR